MEHTILALVPLIAFAATSAGAGWIASILFDRLRVWFPLPDAEPTIWYEQLGYTLLYAPQYARYSSWFLAAVVSVLASALLAYLTGGSVGDAIDTTVAALVAVLCGQAKHAYESLPSTPAYWQWIVTPEQDG